MENVILTTQKEIEYRIFTIRGVQVMIDSHLAEMYGVETKNLNKAVNRNLERFPEYYRFKLTDDEFKCLRFQFGTSSKESIKSQFSLFDQNHGGRRYLPFVFTEQGVAMLSAVLRSKTAINVSIQIMNAFVEMRKLILNNAALFQRLDQIEIKQIEADQKFEQIFKALESQHAQPEKGIFYDGQVFDAYTFVADLIRNADKSIILIDNYIDDTVFTLFAKRKAGVHVSFYTKNISKQLKLDVQTYNAQYPPVEIKEFHAAHDRFLIIDERELYHLGASLKDLGKKWFAFSKMDSETGKMLNLLKVKQ